MQVASAHDYDTHAIMGGQEIMEFGVAQTAEFFEVLSSTLYSNKPLAVIREVLCNAWDAHIAAGVTDKAVTITIDDNKMVIRDYGHGIAHKDMHPIYCIYGNSTKKNDGKQTGGFGLGSKAPFAYTHHFTVTSHHLGVKTVYAISRGSSKTDGKPDCRVMVKVPTTESGLEVSIPLKESGDQYVFRDIIKTIAYNGEMRVSMNGTDMETLPMSKGTEGFLILHRSLGDNSRERIHVRYGNVIYPIPEHKDYAHKYKGISNMLDALTTNDYYSRSHNWNIVFQADPNTIAVTPSRESLSMVETTIATLTKLLDKIGALGSTEYHTIAYKFAEEAITKAVANGQQYKMLHMQTLFSPAGEDKHKNIYSYEEFVRRTLSFRYPSGNEFQLRDQQMRWKAYLGTKPKNVKAVNAYMELLKTAANAGYLEQYKLTAEFIARNVTGPIVAKMLQDPKLDVKNLNLVIFQGTKPTYMEIKKISDLSPKDVIDIMKNSIIVTQTRQALREDIASNSMSEFQTLGKPTRALVYTVSRAKGVSDYAVEFFKKLGLTVVDHVAYRKEWEEKYPVEKVEAAPKKPKIVGIPKLHTATKHGSWDIRGHMVEDAPRIEKPAAVFQPYNFSGREYGHKFYEFGDEAAYEIALLYGDKIGVCVNKRQVDAYIAKGSQDGYTWLPQMIHKEMSESPNILKQISYQLGPWKKSDSVGQIIQDLFLVSNRSELIRKEFSFPEALTLREAQVLRVWESIKPKTYDHRPDLLYHKGPAQMKDGVDAILKLIKDQGVDPLVTLMRDIIKDSKLFGYLDFSQMLGDLNKDTTTPKQKDDIESLLLIALQG